MYQLKSMFLFLSINNLIVLPTCATRTLDIAGPIDDPLKNYDARFRPNFAKHAETVKVSMYITRMFDYSDEDCMAKLNFYFRQSWIDPRLSFDNTSIPAYIDKLNLGSEMTKRIWMPDTFNSGSHKLSFVSKYEANTLVMIYRNGTVFISKRLTARIQCQGSKAWFPFDTKECHFHIESYSMSMKDIVYQWMDDKEIKVDEKLISFHVNPDKPYSTNISLLTGVYSIIGLKITIERYYFHYILCLYLPIILTTLLAGRALHISKQRDSASTIVSALFFVAELICSILIKLTLGDKLPESISTLDLFLAINILFMFFYQLMHICPKSKHLKARSAISCSDTKVILDESVYSDHRLSSFFRFSLTLTYSLFVVSYLFVCITMNHLFST